MKNFSNLDIQLVRFLYKFRPMIIGQVITDLFFKRLKKRHLCSINGLNLNLSPVSHLGYSILVNGDYEPDTANIIKSTLYKDDTFIDVGANEGYFSCMAADIVGPQGRVLAVEPQTRLHQIIKSNIALNEFSNIEIIKGCISNIRGDVKILLYPEINTGASGLHLKYRFSNKSEIVKSFTFDELLDSNQIQRVKLCKIDVEGFENEVITSAKKHLSMGTLENILVDYHKAILDDRGMDTESINTFIIENGYRLVSGSVDGGYALYAFDG